MSEHGIKTIRPRLEEIVQEVSERFDAADRARDLSLSQQRKIIKHCSLSIRALHRREWDEAEKLMAIARDLLTKAEDAVREFPEIYYAGFLQDAQKEYAEARLTQSLIRGSQLPTPEEISVDFAPYMNGMGEAVGEMRRYTLDRIRAGDLEESERVLDVMDEIYCALIGLDYPDAITRGLRRNTDLARACLERTRGDLTNHFDRRRVERALQYIEKSKIQS
jgi:translin